MRSTSLQGLALAAACFLVMCLGHIHLVVALLVSALIWLGYMSYTTR